MDYHLAVDKTLTRLRTQVGHTNRRRHKTISAEVAGVMLEYAGKLIDYDKKSEEMTKLGFSDVFQYAAYKWPIRVDAKGVAFIRNATEMVRYDSARNNALYVRYGMRQFQKHLRKDHHVWLFICPRAKDKKLMEVITFDHEYIVDPVAGLTALDVQKERMRKLIEEKVKALVNNYEIIHHRRGPVCDMLRDLASKIENERLPDRLMWLEGLDFNGEPSPESS